MVLRSPSPDVRERGACDDRPAEPAPAVPPEAVFFAESTEDVAAAVRLCAQHDVPVSLEGHVAALRGGLCIDVSRMAAVLRVSADDFQAVVWCSCAA